MRRGFARPELNRPSDVLSFNTGFTFAFTDEFKVTIARQFDLIEKKLTSYNCSATWFVHCWEASISVSQTTGGVQDIFFSIFISALPEARFNKPTDVSPGYDYQNLINPTKSE